MFDWGGRGGGEKTFLSSEKLSSPAAFGGEEKLLIAVGLRTGGDSSVWSWLSWLTLSGEKERGELMWKGKVKREVSHFYFFPCDPMIIGKTGRKARHFESFGDQFYHVEGKSCNFSLGRGSFSETFIFPLKGLSWERRKP